MTENQLPSSEPLTACATWKALEAHHRAVGDMNLRKLFADDPQRGTRLTAEAAGLYLDYSKQRVTDETVVLLFRLARDRGLVNRTEAMFTGEKLNVTERRAVLHVALRAPAGERTAVRGAGAAWARGGVTWPVLPGRLQVKLVGIFSAIYAVNMYFQSYGAVSIIKVKANWFHVRERGIFGAIFGTLISFGVYFAFDWGQAIVNMTKASAPAGGGSWLQALLRRVFLPDGGNIGATWAVFYVPAAILVA